MPPEETWVDHSKSFPKHPLAWAILLFLSIIGLVLSIALEHLHYQANTHHAFQSFCGTGTHFNCDTVARSPYAVLAGVPTAVWGIVGYSLAVVVTLWGLLWRSPRVLTGIVLWLGILFFGTSATLGAISALLISSMCVLCLGTYSVNALFLIFAILIARPLGASLGTPFSAFAQRPLRGLTLIALFAVATVSLVVWFPKYWEKTSEPQTTHLLNLPQGQEIGGGHYQGAENPILTVTEFSDYECPYCQKAHQTLRDLLDQFPTRLRLVHRHFPLDPSCNSAIQAPMHEVACYAAMLAECAGKQQRFWEANDFLFSQARYLKSLTSREFSKQLGLDVEKIEQCLKEEGPRAVAQDVNEGQRFNLHGTPTFIIEGKVFQGDLRNFILQRVGSPNDTSAQNR
jgi:protein-disulfide isomerase/uncharacterized membrane protein